VEEHDNHPIPLTGSERSLQRWSLDEDTSVLPKPAGSNTEPTVPVRRTVWGSVVSQDQKYVDEHYRIQQKKDLLKTKIKANAELVSFGIIVGQLTTEDLEDFARSFDPDRLSGQMGKRDTIEGANRISNFSRRAFQAFEDDMLG
jgi:hypothetical protein